MYARQTYLNLWAKSLKSDLVWEDIKILSANVFIYLFSLSVDALFYVVLE